MKGIIFIRATSPHGASVEFKGDRETRAFLIAREDASKAHHTVHVITPGGPETIVGAALVGIIPDDWAVQLDPNT